MWRGGSSDRGGTKPAGRGEAEGGGGRREEGVGTGAASVVVGGGGGAEEDVGAWKEFSEGVGAGWTTEGASTEGVAGWERTTGTGEGAGVA